jgi:hypothetical protein
MDKKALLEGLKQFGRVALFAALPVIVSSLQEGSFDWKVTGLAVFVAVLAAVDKWVHENENTELTGITPW